MKFWTGRSLTARTTVLFASIACVVIGTLGAYFYRSAELSLQRRADVVLTGRVEHFSRIVRDLYSVGELKDRPLLFETMLGAEQDVLLFRRPGEAPFIDVNPGGVAVPALQAGEVDWWELALHDLVPTLRRNDKLRVATLDPTGMIGLMRPNHLHPPFDNVEVRRALARAIVQSDFMTAAAGTDTAMWRDGVGVFCPASPFASTAGLKLPIGIEAVKQAVTALGIAPARIDAEGHGSEEPVSDNDRPRGRVANRRVEIKLYVPPSGSSR